MKIVVVVTTHPLYGVRPQAQASIDALDMTGHDVDVVYIDETGIDNRLPHFDHLLEKHKRIPAIAAGYDAVLSVEYDNVIPPDTIQRLASVDADVVHGLYCNRRAPYLWLANIETTIGRGITFSRNEETVAGAWGNVVQTQGVGLGCTLIHKRVIDNVPFRREPGHPCADDWFFAVDCISAGYRIVHDCGCIVGHILDDGMNIVWPSRQKPFYRIEGNLLTANEIQTETGQKEYVCLVRLYMRAENAYYQPGDTIVLPDSKATELLASGSVAQKKQSTARKEK
jgi:hypothetical protein